MSSAGYAAKRMPALYEGWWSDEEWDPALVDAETKHDWEADGAARFAERREDVVGTWRRMGRLVEWWDRWEASETERVMPEERDLLHMGRRWAAELQALMAATLARLEGDSAGSREWEDEAYAAVLGAGRGYQEFGLETGRIDCICEAHNVQRVVLFPSVMRRELEPGCPVEALVELAQGAVAEGAVGPRQLQRELTRQLGRRVEVFLVSDLKGLLVEDVVEEALRCGVCIYYGLGGESV